MTITFDSDKVDLGKKRVDGTRVVDIHVGEYQAHLLKDIIDMPEGVVKVTLELVDANKS